MEQEGFAIERDDKGRFLRLKTWGFWTQETLDRYEREITRQFASSSDLNNRILVDMRDQGIQAQETVARLKEIHQSLRVEERRVAVIVRSSLQGMQTRRINPRGGESIFMSEEEAVAWLMNGNGS